MPQMQRNLSASSIEASTSVFSLCAIAASLITCAGNIFQYVHRRQRAVLRPEERLKVVVMLIGAAHVSSDLM